MENLILVILTINLLAAFGFLVFVCTLVIAKLTVFYMALLGVILLVSAFVVIKLLIDIYKEFRK